MKTWRERTKEEAAALKDRRAARRARKQRLANQLWSAKDRAAGAPPDRAALAYDRARKSIVQGDPATRDARWLALAEALNDFRLNRLGGDGP